MIIKHDRHVFEEVHEVCKGLWAFFLDYMFWMLIGRIGKLQSHGKGALLLSKNYIL